MNHEIASNEMPDPDAMCHRVIEAVAEAKGVDPLDLPPLYKFVDPCALERVFAPTRTSPRATGRVTFEMDGCEVVVESDGSVNASRAVGKFEITEPLGD